MTSHPLGAGVRMLILCGLQFVATPVLQIVSISIANNNLGTAACLAVRPTDSTATSVHSGMSSALGRTNGRVEISRANSDGMPLLENEYRPMMRKKR
jgi:hypothetical protein